MNKTDQAIIAQAKKDARTIAETADKIAALLDQIARDNGLLDEYGPELTPDQEAAVTARNKMIWELRQVGRSPVHFQEPTPHQLDTITSRQAEQDLTVQSLNHGIHTDL